MFNTKIFDNGTNPSNIPIDTTNYQQQDNNNIQPQPIDITFNRRPSIFNNSRFRRESVAHSQGMGGISWGSVTIGSWLKDEVMSSNTNNFLNPNNIQQSNINQQLHHNNQNLINPRRGSFRNQNNNNNTIHPSMSPNQQTSYLPNLEADYCKDYNCCGEILPTLHDLLRHYEESHISASPPIDSNQHLINNNRNRNNYNNIHNVMETVSTTDVFLNNNHNNHHNHNQNNNDTYNIQNQINSNQQLQNHQNHQQIQQNHSQHPQQFQQHPHQQQHQSQQQLHQQQFNQSGSPNRDIDMETGEDEGYIDDPARHLYYQDDEHKPFKCNVIGCDKSYKNQNGLKYHRSHGHQGQTLRENPDGTVSVIDPDSNNPMDNPALEKDKPYKCNVCNKRYKNLNGLKYHRGHTTH
ncbi:SFP1 [Candida pseudojiufengensis]|uniref:SFP1 n=1 Tax=Candida pseudojiufengensis TaxID=497109 RepID=UPI0022252924|nr:SFP1 [Candida pseudojiufengensis]KAI5967012.1 SFP1 [Candida pseudojiufengensis]